MKRIGAILAVLICTQCSTPQENNFNWLIGTWKLDGQNVYELWASDEGKPGLSGISFSVDGIDTLVSEVISLEFSNGHFHYIPDVAGDQAPVDFTIISTRDRSFVAENPQHDFPKVIRYERVAGKDEDLLHASIEGNGKKISYSFRKIE